MCLGANEPGGPRRCEGYMRNVHSKMVELQQNIDLQNARSGQIEDAQRRITQIDQMDKSKLTARDEKAYGDLRSLLDTQMSSYKAELENLKEQEASLRKSATTALANHNAEIERRKRMGSIIDERGNSPIDEDAPYMTVTPDHFKQIQTLINKHEQSGNPLDYKVRTRMVPVHISRDSYHPFLTVEEIDVQFENKQIQDRFGVSDSSHEMGHNDQNKWRAPTEKVLQAAFIVSDGGRNYVSQKNADDPEESTGGLVKSAVFSVNNASLVESPTSEISDLRSFARQYPGDTAYAHKVRTIAAQDYVSPQDTSVLTSAIAGWRQYKDRKGASMSAARKQPTPGTGTTRPQPSNGNRTAPKAEPRRPAAQRSNPGKFVGEVGDTLNDTKMTVKAVRKFPSQFGDGTATMLIAQDSDGNTYKWNASSDLNVKGGDDISLRGIIKEHAEYNGIKQTVITRGKLDIISRV